MMLPSSNICALLLWGGCLLLPAKTVTTSEPENSSLNVNVPTDVTIHRQTTEHAKVLPPVTLHPGKTTDVADHQNEALLPTVGHSNGVRDTTNTSKRRRLGLTTAEATSGSIKTIASKEKVTTENIVHVQTAAATLQTAGVTGAGRPQSVSDTITARAEEKPFSELTTVSSEVTSSTVTVAATEKENVSLSKTTSDAQGFTQVTSTERQKTAKSTSAAEAVNKTTDHLQTSASSFTDMTAPLTGSAASAVSTQHSTSLTEFMSEVPSTSSLNNVTQITSTLSGPTASTPPSGIVKSTSPELSFTSHSVPTTTASTGPASNSTDYHNTTTANSTSPAGVFIPLALSTTTSFSPTTRAPCEPSDSTIGQLLPCSTRGVVKQCLVAIAVLALVATIFIVSTIVLCVKLSKRKYKVRKPQQGTEMMCISSLLPDRSHTYTRHRNPVSNGVLVFPAGGDSDEEGGDNLTLSSFLPENDRYV